MDNLNSFIRAIKAVEAFPDIDAAVEEEKGLNTLSASSSAFLAVADDEHISLLENVELSAAHFLFSDINVLNKEAVRRLYMEDVNVKKVGYEHLPYTHCIETAKFCILISQ